jgi:3'(2'), 5'-bisphosphate nucleotidase
MVRAHNSSLAIVGEEDDNVRHNIDQSLKNQVHLLVNKEMNYSRTEVKDVKWSDELLNLPTHELAIFIDPLDGTREYSLGMADAVTVLCGVTRNGRPIGGVIHCPLTGTTVWGAVGVGVIGMEELKHQPSIEMESDKSTRPLNNDDDEDIIDTAHRTNPAPPQGGIIVTTRSHFSVQMRNVLRGMDPQCILRSGGAGSKVLLILSGRADAYVYPSKGTKSWDTCACEAILLALGGKMSDSYGNPLIYDINGSHQNDKGVLATLKNHDHYILSKNDPLPQDD